MSDTRDTLICDRCHKEQPDASVGPMVSAGIYVVDAGDWAKYANPGERLVCDDCMHADPRYRAIYGPFDRAIETEERG